MSDLGAASTSPVAVETGLGPYDGWDLIAITGVAAEGCHGVYDHEQTTPQPFVLDVVLRVRTDQAAASDDLSDTLDYVTVATHAAGLVRDRSYGLIETLADVVARAVLGLPGPHRAVSVTVHKPRAAEVAGAADVAVTVHRHVSAAS